MIKTYLEEYANRVKIRKEEAKINVGGNDYAKGQIYAHDKDYEDIMSVIKRMEERGLLKYEQ